MKYEKFPCELFIRNRSRLVAQLPPKTLAVVNSSDILYTSADGEAGFIQQTDLFYLSGIDQEETILLLFPDAIDEKHREVLFLRETNENILIWEGYKLTKEQAKEISGIETIYWTHEFEKIFRQLAIQCQNIFLNTNEHLRAVSPVQSRDDRFILWCKEKFPLHNYGRLQPILHDLRAIKSDWEIKAIAHACAITEKAFRRVLAFVKPGVWEYEIEAEIVHEFLRNRSRRPAYSPIIASGANACVLHYTENSRMCHEGDLLLLDFGAEYANYSSDLSRTIPVSGRYSERQLAIYKAVLRTMRMASDMLVPGNTLDNYEKEVGKYIESELIGLGLLNRHEIERQNPAAPLYKKYFMHGTSHHLGLNTHDYGHRHKPFAEGMVFTCEPGIYIREEGIGVRIENDFVVRSIKPLDLMANIPVEAEEIEEIMNS